ncbi:Putative Alpha/beta hydrolase fold domain containing protein [[Torrubiella] hemipterigena]|uniref:Putative Alpha/beta hydrolase fold domain containing protein n=1 Tax=[Torrubiella] hemipterigena TaxID=1531966 RepID=A0A0A1STX0_9HYPO|nr:Putative Alpha/beta hydrolase fold domain containing protein [[Torrubiella] hemipterigena]
MRISFASILAAAATLTGLASAGEAANGTIDNGPFPNDLNGSNFTYPFPVKLFKFTSQLQQLEMAFMDVKVDCKQNGKTAVLFHGKNFCGPTWETTIRTLANKGYRVIALDQVGFCKSSKPMEYQFSLNQLAWNSRGLLNALGVGNVTVIGHSLGGMLSFRFALQYPETVDEMVIVDAVGLEDYVQKGVPYISVDDQYKSESMSTFNSIKAYESHFYYVDQWLPAYDTWVNMLVNIYNGSKREAYLRCQARIVDLVLTSPIAHYFGDIKTRTLLMVGGKDATAIGAQWSPPEVAAKLGHFDKLGPEVVSQLQNGELIEFPDLGHAPQISAPDRFHSALVNWLHY